MTQTCMENIQMKSGATINHISKEKTQLNNLAHSKLPKHPNLTRVSDDIKEPKNRGGLQHIQQRQPSTPIKNTKTTSNALPKNNHHPHLISFRLHSVPTMNPYLDYPRPSHTPKNYHENNNEKKQTERFPCSLSPLHHHHHANPPSHSRSATTDTPSHIPDPPPHHHQNQDLTPQIHPNSCSPPKIEHCK